MPWTVVWSQRIRVEGEEVLNLEHSWFCQQINLFAPALIIIHEVEERVCDEMINVSDNVHDDEVETALFRQVVLRLDIDLQQFVVMKEEQVVTEK